MLKTIFFMEMIKNILKMKKYLQLFVLLLLIQWLISVINVSFFNHFWGIIMIPGRNLLYLFSLPSGFPKSLAGNMVSVFLSTIFYALILFNNFRRKLYVVLLILILLIIALFPKRYIDNAGFTTVELSVGFTNYCLGFDKQDSDYTYRGITDAGSVSICYGFIY